MEYQSPLSMLFHWEKETPYELFLREPVEGEWQSWTWRQIALEVRQLGAALLALKLPKHSHIAILSKNSAHWMVCDLGIMLAGHVSVPLYPNTKPDNLKEILEHSESVVLFVGKLDNWDAIKNSIPAHIKCISLPFCMYEGCEHWSMFTGPHRPLQGNITRASSDLCSIIYTSGTSGAPKGAMFTFAAFSFVAQNAIAHLGFRQYDRFFSYLPLSHIAERVLVEMVSLYAGGQVYFAESLQSFAQNMADAKPTVFLGVHRIWSKFQQGVLAKMPQQKLNILLQVPFLAQYIKKKIRKDLGLHEASLVFTGASPTPPDLLRWFARIGINIQEAYAMTENCSYSHVTIKEKIRIGFVGQPLPDCEVRLGVDNEIQVKHFGMMKGYFKDPGKTAEAFTPDGFLKTGDEGFIDTDSFLKITGRIKDIFKTAKGKYVVPSPIEMKFATNPFVEQVCVVGSGLPQPMALVTLSAAGRKQTEPALAAALKKTMVTINASLDAHERLDKIIVLKDQWLVENNLLTPSLKIRRHEIEMRYAEFYEEWYNRKGAVIH
ncbi:AMP-binding protein [Flavihumibacter fluvii]|uniref:AMP-binding protein n=1 Tax=Flavihumibacter fluvii TaxID=2838157 RepID=UPI001BDEC93B|nr:AMP-binding protein [Flavihumibacter fluvii]ULQ50941.1 AMP-binding protein [Flavihumibacter fluvii]